MTNSKEDLFYRVQLYQIGRWQTVGTFDNPDDARKRFDEIIENMWSPVRVVSESMVFFKEGRVPKKL